jgi:LPS sulfotransferase NodH
MATSKFLIVCTARTGSNLLVRSLNRPPRVRCFGEVAKLSFPTEGNAFTPFERLTGRTVEDLARMQQGDVVGFIFDTVYAAPAPTVGFKLFYEHCREAERAPLWQRLADNRSLRIVHLTRNATFDLYVSLLYAQRTDQWFTRHDEPEGRPNDAEDIEVDIEHCRKFLLRYRQSRGAAAALFSDHPYMEIDYNDLEDDLAGALTKVRRFIGAPDPQEDRIPLRKQSSRKAVEKVRNYQAVKAAFAGGDLESVFATQ